MKYTIIAYDSEQNQSIVDCVKAKSGQHAAIAFAEQRALSELIVLAVIPGDHKAVYPESLYGESVQDLLTLAGTTCEQCKKPYPYAGDGYDGLCPDCADKVKS